MDSLNGSDTNSGTSIDKPWRTLTPVNATKFFPGNTVHFKRGSSWTGGLYIRDSGEMGNPITFKAYGIGSRPIFSNPGDGTNWAVAVKVDASWVIVEDMLLRDAHDEGLYISQGSDHNVVQNIEAYNVGIGTTIVGQHNLITHNYFHDLHMIKNTPGGDDDYGALAVSISNSYNEISYNRMINCIAPSYDYGKDGGAVEWWSNADNNYVHHNWAINNDGFLEVGGGSAINSLVAYNVSINNGKFSRIHLNGKFASTVENFRIENNTIIENVINSSGWAVFGFDGDPQANTLLVRNNILYVGYFVAISNKSSFTHEHNIYYVSNGTALGFTLGIKEQITDPLFVNLGEQDFHLLPTSPAINAGTDLGFSLDFENLPVPLPVGTPPDLGAYEYQSPPS